MKTTPTFDNDTWRDSHRNNREIRKTFDFSLGYRCGDFTGDPDFLEKIRAVAPNGVDVVFDLVGKTTFPQSLAVVRSCGKIASIGAASGWMTRTWPVEILKSLQAASLRTSKENSSKQLLRSFSKNSAMGSLTTFTPSPTSWVKLRVSTQIPAPFGGKVRQVVERSFAWLNRFRRLACYYEHSASHLAASHWVAAISLALQALLPHCASHASMRWRRVRRSSILPLPCVT